MSVELVALLIILLLFALFVIGVEIGFAMAVAGFIGFGLIVNFEAAFDLVAMDFYTVFSSYGFTIIPLFVLMGMIGASAGVSKSLYELGNRWIGHVPGGARYRNGYSRDGIQGDMRLHIGNVGHLCHGRYP